MDDGVGSSFSSMQYLVEFQALPTLDVAAKRWPGRAVNGTAALLTVN